MFTSSSVSISLPLFLLPHHCLCLFFHCSLPFLCPPPFRYPCLIFSFQLFSFVSLQCLPLSSHLYSYPTFSSDHFVAPDRVQTSNPDFSCLPFDHSSDNHILNLEGCALVHHDWTRLFFVAVSFSSIYIL